MTSSREEHRVVALDDERILGDDCHALRLGYLPARHVRRCRLGCSPRVSMSVSDEIPELPETPPERGLRGRGHREMTLPCPHAVPARPGVVGDERGERGLGAFEEARETVV